MLTVFDRVLHDGASGWVMSAERSEDENEMKIQMMLKMKMRVTGKVQRNVGV